MKKLLCLLIPFSIGQINGQIINTVAGNGTAGYSGDGGQAIAAELNFPVGVAFDKSGNWYIADNFNNRIRKVTAAGIITTIAGNGTAGYSGDGGPATSAALNSPHGLTCDNSGNLFIVDYLNSAVRKVDASGTITTIAGNGISGYSGDGGQATAAQIQYPYIVITDAFGNIYIGERFRVRKINVSGIITTVAGNGTAGFSGDGGQATAASVDSPVGLAIDVTGNIFISDLPNQRVRKVDVSGIITTIAGTGMPGFSGDGGQAVFAELYNPYGLVFDLNGNLIVADRSNKRIRMIDTSGIITTIVGNGTQGFSGDGGQAILAELNNALAIAIDTSCNLLIADADNNRIRTVCSGNGSKISESANGNSLCSSNAVREINFENTVSVFPNPTSDRLYIEANTTEKLNVDLYDINGRHIFSKIANGESNIDVTFIDPGIYTMTIKTSSLIANKKLVILH